MKLFVTGGTGFIGSHFLNAALKSGHAVVALRRSAKSQPRVPVTHSQSLQWLDKEMSEVSSQDFSGCDAVVHLAAHSANVPYDTLENCIHWNVIVPLGLFRKAIDADLNRFVVAGSCFEYGRSGERYDFIPTDAPLEPTQSYPTSKALASIAFSQLATERGLQLSIHRIFQVFGEGEQESRLWPSLKQAALAGRDLEMSPSEQIRDFIPVESVAIELLAACGHECTPHIPLVRNIGSGEPQTVRSFAEHWWRTWNAKGRLLIGEKPYREGEVMRYVPLLDGVVSRAK
jgi:nucleoside-diphosphate-sugar epimerase